MNRYPLTLLTLTASLVGIFTAAGSPFTQGYAKGGSAKINALEVHELKSAWNPQ